ncbi:hypothetical protein [Nitrosopumilus adriaticus]|uniref:hypothetical protein n=1 Tax=Nitrosopumilus adriaticus TaxID=1580092 RepID=UPI00352F3C59
MTSNKNEIILIDYNSDINSLKQIFKNHPSAKIFPLDYSTEEMLKTQKISCEKNDFLTDDDCKKIDTIAYDLVTTWYMDKNLNEHLTFEKINFGYLIEIELIQYFINIVSKVFLAKNIIDVYHPDIIITSSQINEYISNICNKKNTEYISIATKDESLVLENLNIKLNMAKIPVSFKISRQKYHSLKNFSENLFLSMSNSKYKTSNNKKSILLFEFNTELYDELFLELASKNKNILLLNTRRPSIWNLKTQKIISKTNSKIVVLDSYKKNIQQKIIKKQNEIEEKLIDLFNRDDFFENIFLLNSISLWPSIKNSFFEICKSRFLESIKRIYLFKEFLANSEISVILIWAETAQEEKELIHIGKEIGIPIVLLQHAMAASEDIFSKSGRFISHLSYSSLTDNQVVWGIPAEEYANKKNQNTKILPVGSPRHDKFFKFKKTSSKSNVILFAPTKPAPLFSKNLTNNSVRNFINFIKEVIVIMKKFPDKKLLIKPHPTPATSVNVIDIAKQIDPKISFTYDSDILKLIDNSDLVITTNNSTIALEAMMLKTPVISLQTESSALEENIVKENAVLSITELKELETTLQKFFNDDNFKKQLLANSDIFLKKYFLNPGSASKILSKILDQI